MTRRNTKIVPAGEFFIYFDGFQGVLQAFNSSIVIEFILFRLVGLIMPALGLPFALSNVRATYFTAKMPGSFQFLGHDNCLFWNPKMPPGTVEACE